MRYRDTSTRKGKLKKKKCYESSWYKRCILNYFAGIAALAFRTENKQHEFLISEVFNKNKVFDDGHLEDSIH